jgi:putative heme-binding domain-containing protein
MWRYHPVTRKFELVAEGTSNPWGWDYRNTDGQMILCCCVIPHLFHITPGGVYKRQSGQSSNPYAYGYLNEICDHTFHKESGWAHAGLLSLDTPLMPPEYRESVIFGSIHGCSIKRNVLKRNGSTFTASRADDFLVSGDKNFRPINLRWGPNGEIFVIDWHDQNPCHQAAAGSWDYEHGRVYRIQRKGAATKKAEDLGELSSADMGKRLTDPNPYVYRTVLRLTYERTAQRQREIAALNRPEEYRRDQVLIKVLPTWPREDEMKFWYTPRGEWIHYALEGRPTVTVMPEIIKADASKRWLECAIGLCRNDVPGQDKLEFLAEMVSRGADIGQNRPTVRLELASLAQRVAVHPKFLPLLHNLMKHGEDATDLAIPMMIWLAYEQHLPTHSQDELDWLKANAAGNPLITDHIIPRAMRRLATTGWRYNLAECVAFAGGTAGDVRLRALEGLTEALKGRVIDMPSGWPDVQTKLLADPDERVKKLTATLAVAFRDLAAARRALAVAADAKQPPVVRAEAIRTVAPTQLAEAKPVLLGLIGESGDVGIEALRALAGFDGKDVTVTVLGRWQSLPPGHRTEAINLLASRRDGARQLLAAVAAGTVEKTSLNANTVLRLRAFKDAKLNADVERVWGKVRDTPAELNKLIDTMRGELAAGPGSFSRGKVVFDNQCAKCHRFEGRGHTVGPELDGAGRDVEYLLVNVLDPNRVVGQPYFIRRLTLKNGRIEEGLLAAEDPQTIMLKGENDARRVFARADVAEIEVVERSMMPEGLDKAMSVQDFRDLVRYVMADPFVTTWTVNGEPRTAPVTGRLPLPPATEQTTARAVADVTAPAAMKARLMLAAGGPLRVTLNGHQVYRATPDQGGIEVDLIGGTNRLEIEATYRGEKQTIIARFHDPERKLSYPEQSSHK